jgi:AraC-like DNA-binding protein
LVLEGDLESSVRGLAAHRPSRQYWHAAGARSPKTDELALGRSGHVSGSHEFVYAVRGRARVLTAEQVFELGAGDLLLVEPGVGHGEMPTESADAYELLWCMLAGTQASVSRTRFSPPDGFYFGETPLHLQGRVNLQSIAIAIGAELAERDWGWDQSVRALLRYLSCLIVRRLRHGEGVRRSESPMVAHDPRGWRVVQTALEFCRAHYREQPRIEEVAAAAGYSASRLSHLFSSCLGQSVADCLRGLRVAHGRSLLETSDLSIAEIAAQVGYSNPSHFTRAFTRLHKVSPRTYRARHQGT